MILRNLVGVAELALDALRIPLHLVGELLAATLPANGDPCPPPMTLPAASPATNAHPTTTGSSANAASTT